MKINNALLKQIESDLGLNVPFVKGQKITVKRCWHFSTDGNAIDAMFYCEEDFIDGMNRVFITVLGFRVIILAFSLMDTHIHFVLYGEFDECNRFMHEYVRRTSRHISIKHGDSHKLEAVPIHHQVVDNDFYLKVVICYVVKNAPVGGIAFNAYDYPWSSGPLYFRRSGYWSSPNWTGDYCRLTTVSETGAHRMREILKSRAVVDREFKMAGRLVFPGEYVAYEIVERIFRSCKAFNFFMCISKEDDVESLGGIISHLTIPLSELRQIRNEICREMFNASTIRGLSTGQRVKLARTLKARCNSSPKQIAKISGLTYAQIKELLQ